VRSRRVRRVCTRLCGAALQGCGTRGALGALGISLHAGRERLASQRPSLQACVPRNASRPCRGDARYRAMLGARELIRSPTLQGRAGRGEIRVSIGARGDASWRQARTLDLVCLSAARRSRQLRDVRDLRDRGCRGGDGLRPRSDPLRAVAHDNDVGRNTTKRRRTGGRPDGLTPRRVEARLVAHAV